MFVEELEVAKDCHVRASLVWQAATDPLTIVQVHRILNSSGVALRYWAAVCLVTAMTAISVSYCKALKLSNVVVGRDEAVCHNV